MLQFGIELHLMYSINEISHAKKKWIQNVPGPKNIGKMMPNRSIISCIIPRLHLHSGWSKLQLNAQRKQLLCIEKTKLVRSPFIKCVNEMDETIKVRNFFPSIRIHTIAVSHTDSIQSGCNLATIATAINFPNDKLLPNNNINNNKTSVAKKKKIPSKNIYLN